MRYFGEDLPDLKHPTFDEMLSEWGRLTLQRYEENKKKGLPDSLDVFDNCGPILIKNPLDESK